MRAIVHAVSDRLADCELTFRDRVPIDVARARQQHAAYCALLGELGVAVESVDVSPAHADAVFVEDTAVVLDEVAVAAAMGAPTRRAEVAAMLPVLQRWRLVLALRAGTLEGGDVLALDRDLFVGRSRRTDDRGIAAFCELVAPFGYRVHAVAVAGCLHLKTAVTAIGPGRLLADPRQVDARAFAGHDVVAVAADEPGAANALLVGATVCLPASCPRTAAQLAARGFAVRTVDIGEFEKAEAGLTCLSLLFTAA